jgi:LuxR family transcriptional regulator, maltose regulon positive regulatory protein
MAKKKPERHAGEMAKLARPRLYDVVHRERLFQLLDERRRHPLIWISGPPGSGKSTLAASYLEAREIQHLWFQMDEGDQDLATLFYFLKLGAERLAPVRAKSLPLLTPEHLSDVSGFMRRFFRELFAMVARPFVMVFDNVEQATGSPQARELLPEIMTEIPNGVNAMLLSRVMPAPELARHIANRMLVQIGWQELRFTLEESNTLLADDDRLRGRAADTLYRLTDGWGAGLILLREHFRSSAEKAAETIGGKQDAIFSYFAGEIFNRMPVHDRQALMLTALFPRFTAAMAEALTGHETAGRLLDRLYRRNLFIHRRQLTDYVYEYHGLFRAFLLERGRNNIPSTELRNHTQRASEILEQNDMAEEALSLVCGGADYPGAIALILKHAPALIAQGRHQTLMTTLDVLPPLARQANPWLEYWRGMARLAVEPHAAVNDLEKAYAGFAESKQTLGQLMTASAIIDAHYYSWSDFRPLDRWIVELEQLLAAPPTFPSKAIEAKVIASLCIALAYREPSHGLLHTLMQRLQDLLEAEMPTNTKVTAAIGLINCVDWYGDSQRASAIAERLTTELAASDLTPLNKAWWWTWLARHCLHQGDLAAMDDYCSTALRILEESNLEFIKPNVEMLRCYGKLSACKFDEAQTILRNVSPRINRGRTLDVAFFHLEASWLALARGDHQTALAEARTAVADAGQAHSVPSEIVCESALLLALESCGARNEAASVLEKIRDLATGLAPRIIWCQAHIMEAYEALQVGDRERCRRELKAVFAIAREQHYLNFYQWHPTMMARLCSIALEAGIEVDYVRRLIAARGLCPEPDAVGNWAWPIQIQIFGRFSLLRDGIVVGGGNKTQKKPLELLKALIAGGGRAVEVGALTHALWPEAEGDAARASFDSSLYRLRKLLGLDDAVTLSDGRLGLNPRYCRVDAWELERMVEIIHRGATESSDASLVETLLKLYPRHFLAQDGDEAWIVVARDRYRAKFIRAVITLGSRLEQARAWDQAALLYQRALEVDNLAEDVYRRLIVCHREQGQIANAMSVYRRCREVLSMVLGVRPSRETEELMRTLS